MTLDLVLGALAVVLGAALVVGHRRIARAMAEGDEERLRTMPLDRAASDRIRQRTPRWMRGRRFEGLVAGLWLLTAGAVLLAVGLTLILRAA